MPGATAPLEDRPPLGGRGYYGQTAIAVLIMAALGAVMWVGFQAIWGNASTQTTNQINTIGAP